MQMVYGPPTCAIKFLPLHESCPGPSLITRPAPRLEQHGAFSNLGHALQSREWDKNIWKELNDISNAIRHGYKAPVPGGSNL